MSSVRQSLTALVTTAALALPSALTAQVKFQVTPYFASHFPLLKFHQFTSDGSGSLPSGTKLNDRQTNAPAIGGKLTAWLSPQVGIEADVNYAFTGLTEIVDPQSAGTSSNFTAVGNQITATGRVVYRPRRSNLLLGVGGGYMKRGGEGWNENNYTGLKFNKSNFTGVASVGARASVTPHFSILVALDALVYSVEKFKVDPTGGFFPNSPSKFQTDIQIKVGIPIGAR
jgi:hypothetical protein